MYAFTLTAMGFDVMVAADSTVVHKRVSAAHPDIIVVKSSLSTDDSWALLRDLKSHPDTCAVPIVVVTEWPSPSVRERARREGCAALCVKPLKPDALAAGLRALLDRSFVH